MELNKITEVAYFLEHMDPAIGGSKVDVSFAESYLPLEALRTQMRNYSPIRSEYQKNNAFTGTDGHLCRLTDLVDSDMPEAKDACYQLARYYLGLDLPEGLKMPYNEFVALGFLAKAIRLGHVKAQEEYMLLADSLGFYNSAHFAVPKDKYTTDLLKDYYLSCHEMSVTMGGRNKSLDVDGLIHEMKEGKKFDEVKDFYAVVSEKAKRATRSFEEKVLTLERSIPDDLCADDMFDSIRRKVLREKRIRRWLRRLLVLAVILATAPTISAKPIEEVNHLVSLDTMLILFNTIITLISIKFSPLSVKSFRKKKRMLIQKHGLNKVVAEANNILNDRVALTDSEKAQYNKFISVDKSATPFDEFAIYYHFNKFYGLPTSDYTEADRSGKQWSYQFRIPQWFDRNCSFDKDTFLTKARGDKFLGIAIHYTTDARFFTYDIAKELWAHVEDHLNSSKKYGDFLSFPPCNLTRLHYRLDLSPSPAQLLIGELTLAVYQEAADSGDKEAMFRIADALYPDSIGYAYAKKAELAGHPTAKNLAASYYNHYNPPEEISEGFADKSKQTEPDPDPWGFKAWGKEVDDFLRDNNDYKIDRALARDEISKEDAYKLKEKFGKR